MYLAVFSMCMWADTTPSVVSVAMTPVSVAMTSALQENYSHTVSSRLGSKVRVIGWINNLAYFRHLVSLSLSGNQLEQFPVSLCTLFTLQVRCGMMSSQ